jgi:hypothetical protein
MIGGQEQKTGLSSDKISINWEGIPELQQAVKDLEKDTAKRTLLIQIFKAAIAPYERQLKVEIPKASRSVRYHRDGSITFRPGNLRRSIKKKAYKHKESAAIWVGPDTKMKARSGYYGYFILPGTVSSGWQASAKKTNWKGDAWAQVEQKVANNVSKELEQLVKKVAVKHGFRIS